MTVPMDNSTDNPARERVQRLLNQNAELENRRRKAAQARVPSDPNAWQQMRENFQAILLEDHDFSEQHEIEYALWQLHYRRIEELRAVFNAAVSSAGSNSSQNGKGPARGGPDRVAKIRSQFKTFLTEATGFYHDLMLKIRAKYGLPLGFLSGDSDGQIALSHDGNRSSEQKKGLISCNRCFIYLGDLARYKGLYGEGDSKALDFATASSYYMQATSLWPSSGNPHHQLAILASYSGDELIAIYRYFRSLAVDSPFITARDNLIIAFEKNRQSYSQLLGGSKSFTAKSGSVRTTGKGKGKGETRVQIKDARSEGNSANERSCHMSEVLKSFNVRFVRLNGILFTRTSLETFEEVFLAVKSDFLELLSSGTDEEYNFGPDASDCRLAVIRLVAIFIFTIHNMNRESENQSYAEILQRSVLLENAFSATFELMGLILERCSLLNDPSTSYLLPGIMVFVEWLACNQDIAVGNEMEEKQASARLFFWNHCIAFFNNVMSRRYIFVEDEDETCFVNMSRYEEGETANRIALPEDFELRGFLPLLPAQVILDFSGKLSHGSEENKERKIRIKRILAAGKALANVVRLGDERLHFNSKLKKFAIGHDPQISDDYLLTSLEAPKLGYKEEEEPVLSQLSAELLQPKPQLHEEAEEEDEVIVFKPFMAEKHVDGLGLNPYSSEALVDEASKAKINFGIAAGSFIAGRNSFSGQNAFSNNVQLQASGVDTNSLFLQPLHHSTSILMPEQVSLLNGMTNLNLLENGPTKNPEESQNCAGALQPPGFSVPLSQVDNYGGNNSVPISKNLVPPRHDIVMSVGADNLSMKSSSVAATGLKKSPVSRPARRMGPPPGFGSVPSKTTDESLPPPGFGSVPSKTTDESLSAVSLKTETTGISHQMDDYRWLDGYSFPVGSRSSVNHLGPAYHTASMSNSSVGAVSFPFPGKQVTTLQPPMDNLTNWPEHQLSERMKLYQEQQRQFYKVNRQPTVLRQQYQGQSLWEDRFFE